MANEDSDDEEDDEPMPMPPPLPHVTPPLCWVTPLRLAAATPNWRTTQSASRRCSTMACHSVQQVATLRSSPSPQNCAASSQISMFTSAVLAVLAAFAFAPFAPALALASIDCPSPGVTAGGGPEAAADAVPSPRPLAVAGGRWAAE